MERKGRNTGGTASKSNGNRATGSAALSDDMGQAVATRLRDLGRRVSPTEISDIWVFPPLPHLEGSGEFLLFTRILPDEMRRLCGAEFVEWKGEALAVAARGNGGSNGNGGSSGNGHGGANGNGAGHSAGSDAGPATARPSNGYGAEGPSEPDLVRRITEYGTMPGHRVARVVAGFRERLGDHREPVHIAIGGCRESWRRVVEAEGPPAD
jgi:hypothetical protein